MEVPGGGGPANYVEVEFEGYAYVAPHDPQTGARMPRALALEMLASELLCQPHYIDGTPYLLVRIDSLELLSPLNGRRKIISPLSGNRGGGAEEGGRIEGQVEWGEWRLAVGYRGSGVLWNPTGEALPCVVAGIHHSHGLLRISCSSSRIPEGAPCQPRVELAYPAHRLFPPSAQLTFTMTSAVDVRTKRSISIGTVLYCTPEEVQLMESDRGYYFRARRARCRLQQA